MHPDDEEFSEAKTDGQAENSANYPQKYPCLECPSCGHRWTGPVVDATDEGWVKFCGSPQVCCPNCKGQSDPQDCFCGFYGDEVPTPAPTIDEDPPAEDNGNGEVQAEGWTGGVYTGPPEEVNPLDDPEAELRGAREVDVPADAADIADANPNPEAWAETDDE